MKLYDFDRSSAAYRVRIALALKGLRYDSQSVGLRAGEQHQPWYLAINPQALAPTLESDHGLITQSLAIIEYLEEMHPEPPLLPRDPGDRARARALALAVAAEIHPIQNLRVLNYVRDTYKVDGDAVRAWAQHWVETGLAAFQKLLGPPKGKYCLGDQVMLPDVLLAPQMVNARRFRCDLAPLGRLVEIDAALRALPAFRDTAPPPQSS